MTYAPNTLNRARALLAAIILIGNPMAFAGTPAPGDAAKAVVEPPPAPSEFFKFDVQERLRFELRSDNFDFNESVNSATDDTWLLQRFRIGLLIKPARWFKLYAQGQDSREFDSDRPNIPGAMGAEGDDWFDLRQGWIEFANYDAFPLGMKIGRQILSYGDERLVGAFDWNNIGRTFDAVKFTYQQRSWSVDVFAASVVNIRRDEFNPSDLLNGNETDRGQVFAGTYLTTRALPFQTTDVYAFYLHQNGSKSAAPPNDDTNFATIGTRAKGDPKKLKGFEYDFEGAFQAGEVSGRRLTAFAVHGGAGFNFDLPWKPRIHAEYNYGSGDSDPNDDTIETFQNLFPTNHKFYGYMDLFSWQNISTPAIAFRVSPCETVSMQLGGQWYWLASNEDAWYRANGTTRVRPVNAIAQDADNYVGAEIDFTVTYAPTKWLSFLAGYSRFFAGDYLKSTGPSDDADFGYIQTTLEF